MYLFIFKMVNLWYVFMKRFFKIKMFLFILIYTDKNAYCIAYDSAIKNESFKS